MPGEKMLAMMHRLAWGLLVSLILWMLWIGKAQATPVGPDGGGFLVLTVISFLENLFYAVLAIGALFAVLRLRDKLLEVSFRENVLPHLHRDPLAAAIYYGVWILGGAWIIARAFA